MPTLARPATAPEVLTATLPLSPRVTPRRVAAVRAMLAGSAWRRAVKSKTCWAIDAGAFGDDPQRQTGPAAR